MNIRQTIETEQKSTIEIDGVFGDDSCSLMMLKGHPQTIDEETAVKITAAFAHIFNWRNVE